MKLQVGKKYRRADGVVREIRLKREHPVYPFVDKNGATYCESGLYIGSDQLHQYDLVSEVLQLRVGGRYKDRRGKSIRIVISDGMPKWPFRGDNMLWYSMSGEFAGGCGPSSYDLAEEITTCENCQYAPCYTCSAIGSDISAECNVTVGPSSGCDKCEAERPGYEVTSVGGVINITVPVGSTYTVNGVNVAELQAQVRVLQQCDAEKLSVIRRNGNERILLNNKIRELSDKVNRAYRILT